MSNEQNYICNGSHCAAFKHPQLNLHSFDWLNLTDEKQASVSLNDLAETVIIFVSKGWCKYCVRFSSLLSHLHGQNRNNFSVVVLNHSFVEIPYQDDGFQQFMSGGKKLFNLSDGRDSVEELVPLRDLLGDHCIEFPALLVFDRHSGNLLTNDGYSRVKSLYHLEGRDTNFDSEKDISGLDREFWTNETVAFSTPSQP